MSKTVSTLKKKEQEILADHKHYAFLLMTSHRKKEVNQTTGRDFIKCARSSSNGTFSSYSFIFRRSWFSFENASLDLGSRMGWNVEWRKMKRFNDSPLNSAGIFATIWNRNLSPHYWIKKKYFWKKQVQFLSNMTKEKDADMQQWCNFPFRTFTLF